MTGALGDMGLTAGFAILVALLLILIVFSGRLSPRARNAVAGSGLALAIIAFAWAALKSAAREDWFSVVFFVVVLVLVGWRMAQAYRKHSARLAGEAK